ncbi:MAG: CdaR family protein [Armatimonadota bacterium]|nr:hypothetical protein [bacterium]
MIRHNLFYKLLALCVALGLWLYVNSERHPHVRKSYTVPLTLHNVAKGYAAEASQDEAAVTISGLKSVVDSIQRVTAVVDLDGVTSRGDSAERSVNVRASVFGPQPGDLEDLSIKVSPQAVKVHIEALSGKKLPVEVRFPASPPLGYSYSNPLLSPASISVFGKSVRVSRVKKIMLTLPGKMPNDSIDDYYEVTPLDSYGNMVEGVNLSPKKVRLKLGLVEVPATKTVIVSPSVVGSPKYPARVSRINVTPSLVTLEGRPNALVGVSTVTTDRISIDGAAETITRDVDLKVPPGVNVSGRATVRVTVHIAALE